MAKKPKEPFKTEGMTVRQILNMGQEELNSMSKRDLSRALRTVALAANKRMDRLAKHAIKNTNQMGDVTYTEKGSLGIDFEALYATNEKRFGVGRGKVNRNTIYKEFMRVKGFMDAPSSTIPGAIKLRQKREKAVFGKTREQMSDEDLSRIGDINKFMSDVYSEYHKFQEEYANKGVYDVNVGKRRIKMIQRRMKKGMSGEEARRSVGKYYDLDYVKNEKAAAAEDAANNPMNLLTDTENKSYWD